MTPADMAALFAALMALAAIPSTSSLVVAARAASVGFSHGAATAVGVVLGDLVFILLAVFGLVLLAEALGEWWFLIDYLAGACLIGFAWRLWCAHGRAARGDGRELGSWRSSVATGLLITLADQKAVMFYLAFLPAFVDLSTLSGADVALVALISVVAVGSVKLAYALAGDRAGTMLDRRIGAAVNLLAAGVMLIAGVVLVVRAGV